MKEPPKWHHKAAGKTESLAVVNGKPQFEIKVEDVINFNSGFGHKLLCDFMTFSLGSACAGSCAYCYVESAVRKHPGVKKVMNQIGQAGLRFQDVVISRTNALNVLRAQLTVNRPRQVDIHTKKVVYTSNLVDPALNPKQARETLEACRIFMELTRWDVRLLSKGSFLRLIAEGIPKEFRHRLIFGHSTGIFDERIARVVEAGTAKVTKRIEEHRWLQDHGYRTYGMICPVLPQVNYDEYIQNAVSRLRVDRCEHVWVEALNVRGESMEKTLTALADAGCIDEAERVRGIFGPGNGEAWERYSRALFEACARHIPRDKLRFLQYVDRGSMEWWVNRRNDGAVLLGKLAELIGVTAARKP